MYTHNEDVTQTFGDYTDKVRVSSNYAFIIQDIIPSEVAAPLLRAGATVFSPVRLNNVKAGDRVGEISIGCLGHLAIQFIRAIGTMSVDFLRSSNKKQEIRSLGTEDFYSLN